MKKEFYLFDSKSRFKKRKYKRKFVVPVNLFWYTRGGKRGSNATKIS